MNVTPKWAILAGLALILVAGAIQPAYSSVTPLLTLEETSSTSLTATLANLTPTPITLTVTYIFFPPGSPDSWLVTLPTGYLTGPGLIPFTNWLEPDSGINSIDGDGSQFIKVISDANAICCQPCPTCPTVNPDDTSVTITSGLYTSSGFVDLAVVFDDDGDVAAVPEPSTLSLVVLAVLVSVIGFRRKLGSLLGAAART